MKQYNFPISFYYFLTHWIVSITKVNSFVCKTISGERRHSHNTKIESNSIVKIKSYRYMVTRILYLPSTSIYIEVLRRPVIV